jgi:hypothetical protein
MVKDKVMKKMAVGGPRFATMGREARQRKR